MDDDGSDVPGPDRAAGGGGGDDARPDPDAGRATDTDDAGGGGDADVKSGTDRPPAADARLGNGKVSVGLRGWRFDYEAVFTPDGDYRAFGEMDPDVRRRIVRLGALVGAPCDACWLEYGEAPDAWEPARYVYGEPLAEVVLCAAHEPDFVYWFREDGGVEFAGAEEFDDRFHEWYLDGNRAPEDYDGMEYVDLAPEELPAPPDVEADLPAVGEELDRIEVPELAGPHLGDDGAGAEGRDGDGRRRRELDLDAVDYPTS